MSLIGDSVEIIKSEGFTGPHSLILLTRYAVLSGDGSLLKLLGNTLQDMSTLEISATLAYAYAEYFQAAGEAAPEFCLTAADYLLESAGREDRMRTAAYVKCARAFGREDLLEKALKQLEDTALTANNGAFSALAFVELYRATFNRKYLTAAEAMASLIGRNYGRMFRADDAYDLAQPSMNSAVALLFDELYRITQKKEWEEARKKQNGLIRRLADRYPSKVGFGLCALLSEEFEAKTVVCKFPGDAIPPPLLRLVRFYSPLTEIVAEGEQNVAAPEYYFLKNGILEEIRGL